MFRRTLVMTISTLSLPLFAPTVAQTDQGVAVDIVTSKDGTAIAFEQSGKGPPVILIASALADRSGTAPLAALLAADLTVLNYDRRGRGSSGDTPPYAVAREVEDIEALIDAAGGKAALFGSSSGAVLALEAANRLPTKVTKVVVYEPPFVIDEGRPRVPENYVEHVTRLVEADLRGDAVEYFMTEAVGVPGEFVAGMKTAPMWADMEVLAHTLAYDGLIVQGTQTGKPLPTGRWAEITSPTLVLSGENSEVYVHEAGRALADLFPEARHRLVEGQDHGAVVMAPGALAPVLTAFLTD